MHPTMLATLLGATLVLHSVAMETENSAAAPEADVQLLTSYLEQLLRDDESWEDASSPLLYVEEEEDDGVAAPWKRSRYYRRYPWKRQNGRHRTQYADASRYMCNPTREDVFQLLVALHEAREGNTRRTVNFCNRKRPASTIFTNIRFLGRRK